MLRQVVVLIRRGGIVRRNTATTATTGATVAAASTTRLCITGIGGHRSVSLSSSSLSSSSCNHNNRLLLRQLCNKRNQSQRRQQQQQFPTVFLSSSATRHRGDATRSFATTTTTTTSTTTTTTTTAADDVPDNKSDVDTNKQTTDKASSSSSSSSSSSPEEKEPNKPDEKKRRGTDALRDAVNRMQGGDSSFSSSSNNNNNSSSSSSTDHHQDYWKEFQRHTADWWDSFRTEVRKTWQDLIKSGERKSINKKIVIHPHATPGGDAPYTGPVDIMVIIDPSENLTAWERMQRRLTKAPIIADILSRSEELYIKSGAQKAKQKLDHLSEDAREAWETSQNPWVYRVSSVYDTLTAETPESMAVRELRHLDPDFTLEDWRRDVVEHTLPQIMQWFLEGKINQLKPWLGEGVFKRMAAEMKAREQEGVQIDTHVLGIMNSEILACEPDEVNKGSPIILLHFMCQQINCVRKKQDGEIVEGSEDDIRANSYVAAFQREYDEEKGELNWKIVDFRFNGAIAYL